MTMSEARPFDQTMAWRSVHNFKSIDAAIAHWYKIADGDAKTLKMMRDRVTHHRRQGAKFAGKTSQGSGSSSAANGDGGGSRDGHAGAKDPPRARGRREGGP